MSQPDFGFVAAVQDAPVDVTDAANIDRTTSRIRQEIFPENLAFPGNRGARFYEMSSLGGGRKEK